jgi:Recombinase
LDFRDVQFGVHKQGEFERCADGQRIGFGENELAGALPVVTQFSLHPSRSCDRTHRGWCAGCRPSLVGRDWASFWKVRGALAEADRGQRREVDHCRDRHQVRARPDRAANRARLSEGARRDPDPDNGARFLHRYVTAGGKPYVASAVQMIEELRSVFVELVALSHRAVARTLNERGVKTATGKPWSPVTVTRVRQRLDLI